MKKLTIRFNAPVILTFALLALIVLIPALLYLPFSAKKADKTENAANG